MLDTPQTDAAPVRLADYRAPDFSIETTDLTFRLDPSATRVTARLAMTPRTEGVDTLTLVGGELTLVSLALDGTPLDADRYEATPSRLVVKGLPSEPFTLEIVTEINPSANTKLMGLYKQSGPYCTQCEAEGFRRITYFLDRPDVLVGLHDADRGRRRGADPARQRQPHRQRFARRRPPFRGLARPLPEAVLSLRHGRR